MTLLLALRVWLVIGVVVGLCFGGAVLKVERRVALAAIAFAFCVVWWPGVLRWLTR